MQVRTDDTVDARYRIEQEVTIPGFSLDAAPVRLYSAIDEQLERPVTLQFLSASEARDPFRLQEFVRNGQMAAGLHHPNIASVYDAGEWNGWPYWVMARLGDSSAEALYAADGTAPNVALALSTTRQAAEALHAVRQAGMHDWTFSPQALRVSPSGDICLYPIMGLDRLHGTDANFTSSATEDDPRALSGLLRLMLVGTSDPRLAGTRMFALPTHVVALLDRMYLEDSTDKLTSAGEVAAAIAELESGAVQPTQAYDSSQAAQPAPGSPVVMPYYGPGESAPAARVAVAAANLPASTPEAPTLAAPVAPHQDTRSTAGMHARPYVPVVQSTEPEARRRPGILPVLPLLGLLLLAGVVAVLWPKTNTANGSVAGAGATVTPVSQLAVMPDLRGKTLEEANGAVRQVGLLLGQTEAVRDPNFAANTVARQVPDPGTPLQPGNAVTVTLSLGPEPTPVPQQPAAVQLNPPQQEPAAQPEPQDKKDKDDDKEKEKDDDKDEKKKKDGKKDD
ncbi:MAG: PASTA domain-containing protein [Chloroflexota bacterium]|nr:PASTA domain-containing protein [Chloroflexota bacterium]